MHVVFIIAGVISLASAGYIPDWLIEGKYKNNVALLHGLANFVTPESRTFFQSIHANCRIMRVLKSIITYILHTSILFAAMRHGCPVITDNATIAFHFKLQIRSRGLPARWCKTARRSRFLTASSPGNSRHPQAW